MARKHYTAEQIIKKLREAEVLVNQGKLMNIQGRAWLYVLVDV
jgi:hypothetical protein